MSGLWPTVGCRSLWTRCYLWKWGLQKPSVATLVDIGSCTTRLVGAMGKSQQVLFDWHYPRTPNCKTRWQEGLLRIWGSWWSVSKSIKDWKITGNKTKAKLRSWVSHGKGVFSQDLERFEDSGTNRSGGGSECDIQRAGAQDCRSNQEWAVLSMAKQDGGWPIKEKSEPFLYLP